MSESLDLTDPAYWARVHADPESHGFSAEHARHLAKHFTMKRDEEPTTPENQVDEQADFHIGFYGKEYVRIWLALRAVSPRDAALLLHSENPAKYRNALPDFGDDFDLMKTLFEDVARDECDRNLQAWIAVAHQHNLQASSIIGWDACVTVAARSTHQELGTKPPAATVGPVNKKTPETLAFVASVHTALTSVWNDWKSNQARDPSLIEPTKSEMCNAAFKKLIGAKGKRKAATISMIRDAAKDWHKPQSATVPVSASVAPPTRHPFKGDK